MSTSGTLARAPYEDHFCAVFLTTTLKMMEFKLNLRDGIYLLLNVVA